MKVIDPGSTSLSNAEVLAHIKSLEAHHNSSSSKPRTMHDDLQRSLYRVNEYLSRSSQPTAREDVEFSPERIERLVKRLKAKPFRLLRGEVLQILNHVPRNKVEVGILLEESDERFGENGLEEILKVVEEELGTQKNADKAAEGGAEKG